MRSKTCGGGRKKSPDSNTPSGTTRALPFLLNQDVDYVQGIVPETSIEGRERVAPDDCVSTDRGKEGICIKCNRGGDVLVCSEGGCPIAFHSKCMCCKPQVDDSGSFFCPYCSYKRWIAETRRLRKKAMLAKRALVSFIDGNGTTGNEKRHKDGKVQRKEPDLSQHGGNRYSPDYEAWLAEGGVQKESVQVEGNQKNERGDAKLPGNDQHDVGLDDEACATTSTRRASGNTYFREEGVTPGNDLLRDPTTKENSNQPTISDARQPEFAEDGEEVQAVDSQLIDDREHEERFKDEDDQHERMLEEEDDPHEDMLEEEDTQHERMTSEKDNQHERMLEEEDDPHEDMLEEEDIQHERMTEEKDNQHERMFEEEDTPQEGTFGEEEEAEALNAGHADEEMIEDGTLDASKEGSQDGLELSEENQGGTEDEQPMQPEAPMAPSSVNVLLETDDSDRETPRRKRFKRRAHKKAQTMNVKSARKSSSKKNNTPEKSARKPNEKVDASKKKKFSASKTSRQPRESAEQLTKMNFPGARRKRLLWTPEEEDMLKEGVQRFATSANKNLPWRKILEFGGHIFHPTRTPVDLKDKWRNMMGR